MNYELRWTSLWIYRQKKEEDNEKKINVHNECDDRGINMVTKYVHRNENSR